MAVLTTQTVDRAGNGLLQALVAAAASQTFANTGGVFVIIANASGGAITATFVTSKTVDGLNVDDLTATVGAGATHLIGPFSTDIYNDANDEVAINYSATASVTVGAFKLSSI